MTKLAKRLVSPDSGLVCPDHWSGPDWVMTEGPIVSDLLVKADFAPDPQQQLGLDLIFAVGENGLPACFAFGCVVCRQNLKTGLFKMAAIGWLYVTDERKVVWSAHEMSTTLDAQKELHELMQDAPALSRRLPTTKNRGSYADNGGERIELVNRETGKLQQILFKARTKSGGRGLSGDKVILDEAFALQPSHVGSLIPTMMARPHGQVLYGSSAGKADSGVLRDVRDRGRAGASPRLSYLEWAAPKKPCADPDCAHPKFGAEGCSLDDEELWRKANPTITTGRISVQTIADARQELPPEEFARECLGWWDDVEELSGTPAIDLRTWKPLGSKGFPAPARGVVVLDVEPDRSRATVNVAGAVTIDGDERVLLLSRITTVSAAVSTLKKLRENIDVLEVGLHPSTQAKALVPALLADEIEFEKLTHSDLAGGCAAIQTAVVEGRIAHLQQAEVDAAVAIARTRYVNEAEVWERRDHRLLISPIAGQSAALHRWDLQAAQPQEPPPSPVTVSASAERTADDIQTIGF